MNRTGGKRSLFLKHIDDESLDNGSIYLGYRNERLHIMNVTIPVVTSSFLAKIWLKMV